MQTRSSLIQRVRDRADQDSWQEFVKVYEPLLLSYVRSRGVGDADARDVVQEVLIALLRTLPSFELDRQRGRFRTWLWQITMNALTDAARRQKSRQKAEVHWEPQQETLNGEPDDAWLVAHRQRILEIVLPRIQEHTQAKTWRCFEEHVLKGRSGVEIAGEIGITPNAVTVNAARVLARVREMCLDYLEDLER
jgi:RNA polymerase sigma-70 factor (ECF subfamily)